MDRDDRIKIRAFVESLLAEHDDRAPFGDDDPLVNTGRLDSFAVVKLVMFLETEYGVDFSRIEFDPQRLDSVSGIAGVIAEWRSLV